jgi:hypothetical protein
MNVEHRTPNECILSILKKIERHAAQAPALRERFHPSTFDTRHSITANPQVFAPFDRLYL